MSQQITVAPANGQGLLFTQNGPGIAPGYNAIDRRRHAMAAATRREGVFDPDGWKVTQASGGPSTTVEVKADVGLARVDGTTDAHQGAYVVAPHFQVIPLTITPAHATLPRIDSVILQVLDSDFDGSGAWEARVVLLTGTATAGASEDNPVGAPSLPDSCLHLCNFRVDANDTTIADDQIRDYRLHAGVENIGDVVMNAAATGPGAGWRAMESLALKRAVHHRLYAAVGDTLGAGDGSTTFGNLADARGRVLVHADGTAGRLPDNDTVGASGGQARHTLTAAESGTPAHTHPHNVSGATTVPNQTLAHAHDGTTNVENTPLTHAHPLNANVPGGSLPWRIVGASGGGFALPTTDGSFANQTAVSSATPPNHTHGFTTLASGSLSHTHNLALTGGVLANAAAAAASDHENRQPYLVAGKQYIYTGSVAA